MTVLDFVILGIMGYSGFSGIKRGFIRIVIDVLGMAVSVYVAMTYYSEFSYAIGAYIPLSGGYLSVLSFVIIWGVIFIGMSLFGRLLHMVFSLSILGPFNRIGGLLFGIVRGGGLFALVVVIPLMIFGVGVVDDSVVLKPIKPQLQALIDTYIDDVKSQADKFLDDDTLINKDKLPQFNLDSLDLKKLKSGGDQSQHLQKLQELIQNHAK